MKWDIYELREKIEQMLQDAGFVPELYQVKMERDSVYIFFDKKDAVTYFEPEFDNSELTNKCCFEYVREGKKHGFCVYFW